MQCQSQDVCGSTCTGSCLFTLSGKSVRALMRANGKTIRGVSEEYNLTLKRVREVRERGVRGRMYVLDWLQICGAEAADGAAHNNAR